MSTSAPNAGSSTTSQTIFVRNLPYSWGDRELERCFEHIGPIKRAFVVTTRGAKRGAAAMLSDDGGVAAPGAAGVTGAGGESRGFGFIEFSLHSDAVRAAEEMHGRDVAGPDDAAATAKGGAKGGRKPLAVELSVKKGEKPAAAQPKKTPAAAAAAAAASKPASGAAAAAAAKPEAAVAAVPAAPAAAKTKKGVSVKDVKLDVATVQKAKDAARASDSETSDEDADERPAKRQKAAAKTESAVPAKAVDAKSAAAKPAAAAAKAAAPAAAKPASSAASTTASATPAAAAGGSRTLLLSGINPTVKNLNDHLKGLSASITTILYPSPESTTKHKAARVTFADETLAATAAKLLDRKLIKGDPIRAIHLQNESKSNRLIIRNLPWLVGEKRLHLIFRDCCAPVEQGGGGGKIVSIDLPKEADGKSKGFAFISFSEMAAANLALKKTGTILNARPIAVDWALSKDDYLNRVAQASAEETKAAAKAEAKAAEVAKAEKQAKKASKAAAAVKDEDDDVKVKKEEGEDADELGLGADKKKNRSILAGILGSDDDEDEEEDSSPAALKAKAKAQAAAKAATKAAKESVKREEESDVDMEDADGSDDESDDEEDDDEDVDVSDADSGSDDEINMSDDDDSQASGSSSGSDGDDEHETPEDEATPAADDPATARAKALAAKPSDTVRGCTIFIRNLAYDTREKDLLDKFAQFGEVKYGKVVWDKELDRSKGTAFVQFADPAVAAKVVGMSVDSSTNPASLFKKNRITAAVKAGSGITLGGRVLNIALAVDRDRAATLLEKNKTKQAADKRNLYLANEGNIRADSEAAKSMPPAELAKREKSFREKKKKLKNPNYCVSRTRLSVRNLPLDADEKVLKRVFLKAARDAIKEQPKDSPLRDGTIGQPVVRQVKLLRSADKLDAKGEGKSKRYGFLEFEHHEHSLLALRRLNNNPEAFADMEAVGAEGRRARPFVEFALEDVRKLLIRTQKLTAALKRKALKEKQQAELDAQMGAAAAAAAKVKPQVKSSEQPRKKPLKPVADTAAGGGRGACFTCGQGGHISRNCPSAPAQAEGDAEMVKGGAAKAAPAANAGVGKGKRKATDAAEAPSAGKKAKGSAGAATPAAAAAASTSPAAAPAVPAPKRNKNNRHRDIKVPSHLRDGEADEDRLDAMEAKYKRKMAGGGAEPPRTPRTALGGLMHLAKDTLQAAASKWMS